MKLLEGHDADVAAFVARFSPIEKPVWEPGFRAFGVIRDDGALIAGVVFSGWRKEFGTVELSGISLSRYALRPEILAALGDHAFRKLECFRVWSRTSIDNRLARETLKHAGFVEEGVEAHHYGRGRHAARLRLIRPDWERRMRTMEVAQKAA